MNLVIEPLGKQHDRTAFTCGQAELDDWFRRRASQDERRNVARVFVATDDALGLVGFYSLSSFTLAFEDLPEDDWRRHRPRFQGENFKKNLELVDRVREIAATKQVTPAQLALAWLLAQGDGLVPIPGTKRRKNLEENVAALGITLTREDLQRIDEAAPKGAASGERYEDMSAVNR